MDFLEGTIVDGREVTILFADIVNSTFLISSLDAEDVSAILPPIVERMVQAVLHHGGYVVDQMGDGILAVFGGAGTSEDDAVAAGLAALKMRRDVERSIRYEENALRADLAIRVGIHTGLVAVQAPKDSPLRDFRAVGSNVHIASRIESLAKPGSIFISDSTYLALREHFVCSDIGSQLIKGQSEPLHIWELERVLLSPVPWAWSEGKIRKVGTPAVAASPDPKTRTRLVAAISLTARELAEDLDPRRVQAADPRLTSRFERYADEADKGADDLNILRLDVLYKTIWRYSRLDHEGIPEILTSDLEIFMETHRELRAHYPEWQNYRLEARQHAVEAIGADNLDQVHQVITEPPAPEVISPEIVRQIEEESEQPDEEPEGGSNQTKWLAIRRSIGRLWELLNHAPNVAKIMAACQEIVTKLRAVIENLKLD